MKVLIHFILLLLSAFAVRETLARHQLSEKADDEVYISKECSAALLAGGGVLGAASAAAISGVVLPMIGFTSAGVAGGSFAAWWQSTIGLVGQGSVFATLQSVTAGGSRYVGHGLLAGVGISATQLENFCSKFDEAVENNALVKKAVVANLKAVQMGGKATGWAVDKAGKYVNWKRAGEYVSWAKAGLEDWTKMKA